MIVPRKYMPIISAVGLFCCDEFEETPKQKVINMSKLNKFHFRLIFVPKFMTHANILYMRKLFINIRI